MIVIWCTCRIRSTTNINTAALGVIVLNLRISRMSPAHCSVAIPLQASLAISAPRIDKGVRLARRLLGEASTSRR